MQEEEKRFREDERKRIMDELNKNRASFQAGEKVGSIGFQKLAKYDLLIGSVLLALFMYLNIETVDSPSTEKTEVMFNSGSVSLIQDFQDFLNFNFLVETECSRHFCGNY